MAHILVVDDEKAIRNSLKDILEYEKHNVSLAANGTEGLETLKKESFDALLLDIKMEGLDGMEVLEQVAKDYPDLPVIMISGHGTVDTAVKAIKMGAFDFIEKPLDLNRLLITLRNAMDKGRLVSETKTLRKKVASKNRELIGESAPLKMIKSMIEKVAPTDARVLITGPNGTGKEVVARMIHAQSNRASTAFVEVNCAAIPSELIESELFGHMKGSFTGAVKDRAGKFEQADGGTIFLDEIGDMSLSAQAKVLRALQENKITRVGADKDIDINVRVIAATNKNLEEEIKAGRFREDLYHRLSVILIQVPTLNERLEDIPLLADHFIAQICEESGVAKSTISKDAIAELQKINWTGNIRELRNVIERLLILCDKNISAKDVQMYAHPLGS